MGQNDDVIARQGRQRGKVCRIGQDPGIVQVARLVQSPLVESSHIVTTPGVTINEEERRRCRQTEILVYFGFAIASDDDTGCLTLVANGGCPHLVASQGKSQSVVSCGVGGRVRWCPQRRDSSGQAKAGPGLGDLSGQDARRGCG